jgi:hypothetical protein
MVPLQAADILAHCTLRDAFFGSALDVLKETVLHRECVCPPQVIYVLAEMVVEAEARRAFHRRQIHELSRLLGWGGIKLGEYIFA